MEVEFLQSELLVKALGDKKESYQKAYVDVRQMKYFILFCNAHKNNQLQTALVQNLPNVTS